MNPLKISVDHDKHALGIVDNLHKMRCERELCDIFIHVGSEELCVHRHVLCAASTYFENYFDSEEGKSNIVKLPDEDPKCVKCCIDFMYGRKLSVPSSQLEGTMRLAKFWKLNSLCQAIASLFEKNLALEEFFIAKSIATMSANGTLEKKCSIFGRLHFGAIAKFIEFGRLEKDFVKETLQFKHLKMSEEEKLDAVLRWIKHDDRRSRYLMEMINLVDLKKVPLEYRYRLMEEETIINQCEECSLLFSISFLDSMDITLLGGETIKLPPIKIVLFVGETWHLHQLDPKSGEVTKKHSMLEEMHMGFTAIIHNEYVYTLGSGKSVHRLKYADDDAVWQRMRDMHVRHGATPWSVLVSDKIYVIGGDIGCSTAAVEVYDPELALWYYDTSRPVSSIGSGIVPYGEKIFCFGGTLNGEVSNKVAIFDTASTRWSTTTPMKDAKTHVSPVEHDGKIYIIGGSIANKHSRSVECFNVSTEEWTTVRRLKRPRFRPSVVTLNGCIYAFGGAKVKNMYEKYDIKKNEWSVEELTDGDLCVRGAVTFDPTLY